MRGFLRRGSAIVLSVAALLASAALIPANAASPAITITPTVGPPTTRITVSGTGFGANEAVDVYFDTKHLA